MIIIMVRAFTGCLTLAGNALPNGAFAGVGKDFVKCEIDTNVDAEKSPKAVALKIVDDKGTLSSIHKLLEDECA